MRGFSISVVGLGDMLSSWPTEAMTLWVSTSMSSISSWRVNLPQEKGCKLRSWREIPFEGYFDAIINVGTSFGFFESGGEDYCAEPDVETSGIGIVMCLWWLGSVPI
jgi:hypothetical protein